MGYIPSQKEIAELNMPDFDFDRTAVETGACRFYEGHMEVDLTGYGCCTLDDMQEVLEGHGFRCVDCDEDGLTFYSPDNKTEIYIDDVIGTFDHVVRIHVLRKRIPEDELPAVKAGIEELYSLL